jgi:hypothetical protein
LLDLVDYFCRSARLRIERNMGGLRRNADRHGYRLAQQVLAGKHQWMEEGIVDSADHAPGPAPREFGTAHPAK